MRCRRSADERQVFAYILELEGACGGIARLLEHRVRDTPSQGYHDAHQDERTLLAQNPKRVTQRVVARDGTVTLHAAKIPTLRGSKRQPAGCGPEVGTLASLAPRATTAGLSRRERLSQRFAWPVRCGVRVTQPWRLALNEVLKRRGRDAEQVRKYRLRGSGLFVHVRQPWSDLWVFDEVFHRRMFDPPDPVRRLLDALGRPPKIVDLGGHAGMASLSFLENYPEASITSFEPDPYSSRLLRATIDANGLGERWTLVNACAGTQDGTVRFSGGMGGVSHMETSDDGTANQGHAFPGQGGSSLEAPVRDVFSYLDEVDLLKIDIEGGEWRILEDDRFRSVPARAVVLEFHSYFGPPNPTEAVVRLLNDAGYTVGDFIEPRPDLGEGVVWGWRG